MGFQAGRAFEHIDKLAYEIGPRLAGSRGEQLAADYIRERFSNAGLEARIHDFKFVARQLKRKVTALLFAATFVSILFLPTAVSLAVWAVAIILWKNLGKVLPKSPGKNVVARLKTGEVKKTVAISAHFDSATCTAGRKFSLFFRLSFLPFLALVFTLISSQLLFGSGNWPAIWAVSAAYFIPLCVYLFYTGSIKEVSPGANDNASGVGVLLEVAKVSAETPTPDTEIIFIASSAEEQGLVGMKKIAKDKLIPRGTPVLNLDMVGAGTQPFVIEGNGLMRKVKTSEGPNRALAASIERATKLKPRTWWSHLARYDHIPLLRSGFPTTTLTIDSPEDRVGRLARFFRIPNARSRNYLQIHTKEDVPDKLDPKTIERAGAIVLDFVKTI